MVSIADTTIVKKNNVKYNPFQVGINKPDYMNIPMTSNQDLPLGDEFESSKPKQENNQKTIQTKQETETKDKEHSWVDTAIDIGSDIGAGVLGGIGMGLMMAGGPITLGAVAVGVGVASLSKLAIKGISTVARGKEYTGEQALKDTVTGGLMGLGGATPGLVKIAGKTTASFLAKETVIGAVFSATTEGGTEVARQTYHKVKDGTEFDGLKMLAKTGEGALGGAVFGGALGVARKALSTIIKPVSNFVISMSKSTTSENKSSTILECINLKLALLPWKKGNIKSDPKSIIPPKYTQEAKIATETFFNSSRIDTELPDGFRFCTNPCKTVDENGMIFLKDAIEYSKISPKGQEYLFLDKNSKHLQYLVNQLKNIINQKQYTEEQKARILIAFVDKCFDKSRADLNMNFYPSNFLPIEHTAVYGVGVCRHKSFLTKVLADELGLKVSMVSGVFETESKELDAHIWNEIIIGNEKFLMDVEQCKFINLNSDNAWLNRYTYINGRFYPDYLMP